VFEEDKEAARQIIISEMRKDLKNKDGALVMNLLRASGWMSQGEIRGMIAALPNVPEERKQKLLKFLDDMDAQKRLETN
jgi:ABC-type phosphate/phosphonate transport system substrate-binding protein